MMVNEIASRRRFCSSEALARSCGGHDFTNDDPQKMEDSIDRLINPFDNSICGKCAAIKKAFLLNISDEVAKNYYINGAMEHPSLEPLVHAMLGPFSIGIEVKVPVIDSRHMNAISVQLNHVQMIAAIRIAFLVLDDYKKRIGRYDIGSVHGAAKILNPIIRFIINKIFR